jgi:hypothetical protein
MEEQKINLYKQIRRNNTIVWALVAAFAITTIINAVVSRQNKKDILNGIMAVNQEGEIIPLTWLERRETIHIELKDHLRLFHEYFYQYSAYNVDTNISRALWLADQSIEDLYVKRLNDGWYSKVKNLGIIQEVSFNPEDIIVEGIKEPFRFQFPLTITIKQGRSEKKYSFTTTGYIYYVDAHFPLNPHGFLITQFAEHNKQEIDE